MGTSHSRSRGGSIATHYSVTSDEGVNADKETEEQKHVSTVL